MAMTSCDADPGTMRKKPFSNYIACIMKRLCLLLSFTRLFNFVGQVMLSHDSDQMSQRPQVSEVAL